MDKMDIEKKVKEALVGKFDIAIEKIKPNALLREDLGIDSFEAIELIFEVEDKFGIDIPDQAMADVKTVQGIIDYIVQRMQKEDRKQ